MTFSKYFINYGKSDGKAGFWGAGNPRKAWIARPPFFPHTQPQIKNLSPLEERRKVFYYNELK